MTALERIDAFAKMDLTKMSSVEIYHEGTHLLRAFRVMRSIAIAETDGQIDIDQAFEERMKDAGN